MKKLLLTLAIFGALLALPTTHSTGTTNQSGTTHIVNMSEHGGY